MTVSTGTYAFNVMFTTLRYVTSDFGCNELHDSRDTDVKQCSRNTIVLVLKNGKLYATTLIGSQLRLVHNSWFEDEKTWKKVC